MWLVSCIASSARLSAVMSIVITDIVPPSSVAGLIASAKSSDVTCMLIN